MASETDFVSNNAEFKTLALDIAMHITAFEPAFLRESDADAEAQANPEFKESVLLNQPFIKNGELTVQGVLDGAMQKFGERIEVIKFSRFEIGK